MPIEFRCTGCQRLLRTADDTAGKQARCPECGTVMTVPQSPPQPPQPQSPAPAGALPAAPTPISIGDVFSRTWTIFRQQWSICLAAFLLLLAIYFVIGSATNYIAAIIQRGANNIVSAQIGQSLVDFGSSLLSAWIGTGQIIFLLNLARGHQVDFVDFFRGGPYLVRAYLAALLITLIVGVGLVLFIIPGIVFLLTFSQFQFLIVDRDAGILDSLSRSRALTYGNKTTLFAIMLLALILGLLLVIVTCGLGVLVVGPFLMLLPTVIYLALSGEPVAGSWSPGPPPPGPSVGDTLPYVQK